jgi:hypothetical protein
MGIVDKIKLLFAVRKPAIELVGQMKQLKTGWKTLTWWISVFATLATLGTYAGGFLPATTALMVTVAITFVYQVLRAIKNADMVGTAPLFISTRLWSGILAIASASLLSLQAGGIDPNWVKASLAAIAVIMALAQNLGGQQPTNVLPEQPKN